MYPYTRGIALKLGVPESIDACGIGRGVRRALRVKELAIILGIGVSSVWRLTKDCPEFPKPFSLSPRVTVWAPDEVDAYVETQKAKRDARPVVAPRLAGSQP
jgi:predicted DNA-binding transcriptional regulator AlpA